jgi:hypothetical protein
LVVSIVGTTKAVSSRVSSFLVRVVLLTGSDRNLSDDFGENLNGKQSLEGYILPITDTKPFDPAGGAVMATPAQSSVASFLFRSPLFGNARTVDARIAVLTMEVNLMIRMSSEINGGRERLLLL